MPNRIIKESICTSESIDALSWYEECFFQRLIVNCDDFGRMDARPQILKARLFPLKNLTFAQIEEALNKLVTVGIAAVYTHNSKPYLQLLTWETHQQIRAKKSKYPAPDEDCNQMISSDIKCPRNPIQSESNPNPNPTPRESEIRECAILYEQLSQKPASGAIASEIIFRAQNADVGLVKEAIRMSHGKRDPAAYMARVMQGWEADGIKTLQDYLKRSASKSSPAKNSSARKPDYSDPSRYDASKGDEF